MKIAYKKLLYKHHALLNYYKSNIIIFGYLSYKIHVSVVTHISLGGFNVFPTGLPGVSSLLTRYIN